jgi:hypothetical protein
MSNEEASGGRQQLPLTGVALERAISEELKWLGFRSGAPIYRAEPQFTFDDLKQALFNREKAKLSFWAKLPAEEIRVHVAGIQCFEEICSSDVCGDMFPYPTYRLHADDLWIIDGVLLVQDPGNPGSYIPAMSSAYAHDDPAFSHNDSSRVPVEPADAYLKVLAVVGFDDQRKSGNAIVQRVPSPAGQLIAVPPL